MTAAAFLAWQQAQPSKDKPAARSKPQIKLKAKANEPNANEKRLLQWLRKKHPKCKFLYEMLTLRLPSGTNYTPDFVVMQGSTIVAIYEAKDAYIGKSGRDSKAKFKESRAVHPQWRFVFAQWNGETYVTAE